MNGYRGLFTLSLTALFLFAVVSSAHAASFFSEYVEGSSNNKAIEILNTGPENLDLSQCEILRYSNGRMDGFSIPLTGILAAGEVHVICHNRFDEAQRDALCDQTNGNLNFNGDDAVELNCGGTTLDVIGQIGNDPGSAWSSNGVSTRDATLCRKSSVTSGDADGSDPFDPSLQWVALPKDTFSGLGSANNCAGEPEPEPEPEPELLNCSVSVATIGTVQGRGSRSPFEGRVQTVRGVVTANFNEPKLQGFFLQNTSAQDDGDAGTSDGIWVSNPNGVSVAVGQIYTVRGQVEETFGKTAIVLAELSESCGEGSVNVVTVDVGEFNEGWERFEGMMVRPSGNVVVTNNYHLDRYNEIGVSALGLLRQPTEVHAPGPDALALQDYNQRVSFMIDDASNVQNVFPLLCPIGGLNSKQGETCRAGSEILASSVEGPLDYAFGHYRIRDLNGSVSVKYGTGTRPTKVPKLGAADLRIADYNVFNYFVTLDQDGATCGPANLGCRGADSAVELEKQAEKLIAALDAMKADIIALHELENPKADLPFEDWAVSDLVDRLNSKAGRQSCPGGSYRAANPGGPLGTDAIQNGLIYCDAYVRVDAVDVLDDSDLAELNLSDLSPVFDGVNTNRVVLGVKLTELSNERDLTVVVTHQKSKGAQGRFPNDCKDSGNADPNCDQQDGAGFWNKRRDDASTAIRAWLASNEDLRSDLQLVIGDINAYGEEDPVRNFTSNGYFDLNKEFGVADSYVFGGRWGTLDRALANAALKERVTGANTWAINAQEPRAFDYNEEFKGRGSGAEAAALAAYYSDDEFRSSDHNPLLLSLCMKEDPATCSLVRSAPAMGGFGVAGLGLGLLGLAGLGLRRRK